MSKEPKVRKKHLATATCPACGVLVEIIEKETIHRPSQKKDSTKEIEVVKAFQTTLRGE